MVNPQTIQNYVKNHCGIETTMVTWGSPITCFSSRGGQKICDHLTEGRAMANHFG